MIKISKQEIRWMMTFVMNSRDTSELLRNSLTNIYRSLHELEYENMSRLYDTLQAILDTNAKRITIE